jgi:hypothetical protein
MLSTTQKNANKLNDHHMKTCAGFYLSNGHRCFGARVNAGKLEVMYWLVGSGEEYWMLLDLETTKVRDHNGREIFLA